MPERALRLAAAKLKENCGKDVQSTFPSKPVKKEARSLSRMSFNNGDGDNDTCIYHVHIREMEQRDFLLSAAQGHYCSNHCS